MTTDIEIEERVRAAVASVVKGDIGPDHQRLARIEQGLLAGRRNRTSAAWWWIVLGCGLAGGVIAGYWGLYGNGPRGAGTGEAQVAPVPETEPAATTDRKDEGSGDEARDSRDRDTKDPIIYIGQ